MFFVDHPSLDNLVNKANLVHNLFLVYLSISKYFERLYAHHQEKLFCLCDICYLLFCVGDGHPHRITSTKCRINTTVSPDDGHIAAETCRD